MKIPFLYDIERNIRKIRKFGLLETITNILSDLTIIKKAICDSHLGLLELRLENAYILKKYHHIFYKIKENDICIDCGANIGLISDIFLQMGANVYSFEPHRDLYNMLLYKYKNNNKIRIFNQAVGAENTKMPFYIVKGEETNYPLNTVAASCMDFAAGDDGSMESSKYDVDVIDLCEYIKKNIINEGKRIYILKIDIEGAEWALLEKIIQTKIYEHIDYIFCEEHSRLFKDGQQSLEKINKLIEENNIKNIYLDWV